MDSGSLREILGRAAALLAGDPPAAEREARQALGAAPDNPNALLILGAALRRQRRASEAIATLAPLVRRFPRADASQYELGMALADAGQAGPAIQALQAATASNPDNADAWRALGALLFDRGDARGAEAAFAQHHRALVREPHLRAAAAALYGGRPAEAEALLRVILQANPRDAAAANLMAEALSQAGRHADAALFLDRLLTLAPGDEQVRFRLARSLYLQQRPQEALAHIEPLAAAEPGNPAYQNLLAGALAQAGDFERAVAIYERVLTRHGQHPSAWINYGHALRILGRAEDAAAAYRRAIALDGSSAEGYLSLANLKVGALSDAEVGEMRRIAARGGLPAAESVPFSFALGQALEDRGDYAASFAAYAEGAVLRRTEMSYDADAFTRRVQREAALFDRDFFAARAGFGAPTSDPIFVVGLPRSGSTLVEQVLASHSAVEGLGELPDIGFIGDALSPYPERLAALSAGEARALGERYLAATRGQRRLGRPRFVDKMPNNVEWLGLISLILPNATIIDVRRHPMATGFSAFKQHFAQGQAYSYDLTDLGRYYRDYLTLMDHYDVVLPGRVQRVIYEDLVEAPETQIRRLLGRCGLGFEPACLAFHQTQRAVRTASSEQVRRPMFRDGLDHWRNYEPWLAPLAAALGPALETWRR